MNMAIGKYKQVSLVEEVELTMHCFEYASPHTSMQYKHYTKT